jgi:glycosyltransferase involved in cell wall biosynthesis
MKRVVMLAYAFPPLGGAGVQRTLKFVKYLPEHGWEPTVVTVRWSAYQMRDPSLVRELSPDLRVLRAPELPVTPYLAMALSKLHLERARTFVTWPDPFQGWLPAAVALTLREVRRNGPDVLYTTSAPYVAHLAGLVVHRLTGIPWVADFRDEWAANPHLHDAPASLGRLTRRAERAIAARAHVVVVGDYFDIAGTTAARRTTITNGVDPDDLVGLPATDPPRDRFVLAHVGTLYEGQEAAPVFAALRRLVEAGRLDPARVEVRLVGKVALPEGSLDGLPFPVARVGYLGHDDALVEMRRASALLLYRDASSLAPSGKLYEYLTSERPILCVARPEGLASTVVREWDAGACADPRDDGEIERAILELYGRWEQGHLGGAPGVRQRALERFSRRALTGQLAALLDRVAG